MNINQKIEAKKLMIPYFEKVKAIMNWDSSTTLKYFYLSTENLFLSSGEFNVRKLSKRARRNLI